MLPHHDSRHFFTQVACELVRRLTHIEAFCDDTCIAVQALGLVTIVPLFTQLKWHLLGGGGA